ncbi:BON domain-containing protein [Rhizobium sp. FKL33]|uniref:BON domain-containing protein n=1 Tax=Rhizobium sp. FKL33 TaxID=2562307 RepID=UPI0010C11539|nr:BON domain-containing protein [Rhizobium sp. FKL33]
MVFKPQTFHGDTPEIDKSAGGAQVEARVADALACAADLDATQVAVTEVDGAIVLDGIVLYPEEVVIAADIAARVGGLPVQNRLRCQTDKPKSG